MITRREAERLYKSFFNEISPPNLPADFVFSVYHHCGWGCNGYFIPSRYNRYIYELPFGDVKHQVSGGDNFQNCIF